MLEEREIALDVHGRPLGEDGLPVIPYDDAYRSRAAEHVKEMIGEYPITYRGTPEEITRAQVEAVASFAQELENQGITLPLSPLEALRREHLYEDRW